LFTKESTLLGYLKLPLKKQCENDDTCVKKLNTKIFDFTFKPNNLIIKN